MSRVKKEFQKKHFGFCNASPKDFYCSKWFKSRNYFTAYRMIIFTYCLVWTVVVRMFYKKHYPDSLSVAYLSNWAQYLQATEMAILLLVSIHGLVSRRDSSKTKRGHYDFNDLRWFHKISWMFFTTSTTAQFVVTVLYWTTVSDDDVLSKSVAVVIHQHAINSVLAILNVVICKIPVRLLHIIYVSTFGGLYACVTLVLHLMGKQSVFYDGVLDWESYSGRTAGICLAVAFVVNPICHCVSYLLYVGSEKMAMKISLNSNEEKVTAVLETGSEDLIGEASKESIL